MKLCRNGLGRFCLTLLATALFAMVLGLTLPTTAWASDGEEGTTGFIAGLQTLVNPDSTQEIENDPVRDYEYEPVLRESETVEVEESTPMTGIGSVLDRVQSVPVNSTNYTLPQYIRYVLKGGAGTTSFAADSIVVIAIGICFMWWGVRKVIHMLFAAFRSGRMTVGGYDLNPNSYYFGTRAKDWR